MRVDRQEGGEESVKNEAKYLDVVADDLLKACEKWVADLERHKRIQYSPAWEQDAYNAICAIIARAYGERV